MTYRFAIAGFWGALAFAEGGAAWGSMKGFYLRNLRWWAQQPMADRDGILPVGYGYPNLHMCESYNSPQSPYWAFKAFLPLALPAQHPFWASAEEPCAARPDVAVLRHVGMLVANPPGDAVALVSGQQIDPANRWGRFAPQKYSKFAYSARYGSASERSLALPDAVLDGISASDDRHFRIREATRRSCSLTTCCLRDGVPLTTSGRLALLQDGYHVQVHRIVTPRRLPRRRAASRFPSPEGGLDDLRAGPGEAVVQTPSDMSALIDLSASVTRTGKVHIAPPNTNLVAPKTLVPQLMGELPEGVSVLACAVIAGRRPQPSDDVLTRSLPRPDLASLERAVAERGRTVSLMQRPSPA